MSTYRSAPLRPPPTEIPVKRSPTIALVLLACAVPTLFIYMHSFSRSELTCARSLNQCQLVVVRGPEVIREVKTIPLSSIKQAIIAQTWDRKHRDRLTGIALDVDGVTVDVHGYSNTYGVEKKAWIDEVNRFLQDASRDQLDVRYGSTSASFVGIGIALFGIVFYARMRLRFIVDQAQRVFRVENRMFRTSVNEIPLERITEAYLHEVATGKNRATAHSVALRLVDDTHVSLSTPTILDRNLKLDVVTKINQALSEARSQSS